MSQQPSRVIYLPPGTVAAPQAPSHVAVPGIPFDRNFFENILPKSIDSFCKQADCNVPVVELLTVDGSTHFVAGISGVSDQWVALHTTRPDHEHATQVFIPYQTIFRVEIHPAEDERRQRLGFIPVVAAPPRRPRPARKAAAAARK